MVAVTWRGTPLEIGIVDLFDGSETQDAGYIRSFAQTAEQTGFASIWLPEHILFFDQYESVYPYPSAPSAADPNVVEQHNKTVDGKARVEASEDQGLLDVFQTAVHICTSTTRLRCGSSVLLLPLRNRRMIARELATVSALTGDRFDLGVGVGWSSEELEACETDFSTRGKRNEEMMIQLQQDWAQEEWLFPAPSRPFPRMLVGGHSPAAIRRAGQIGTGWYPWNLSMPQFAEHHAKYRKILESSGRDIAEQKVVAGFRFDGDLDTLPAIIDGYAALGADEVNVSLRLNPSTFSDRLAQVSEILGLGG